MESNIYDNQKLAKKLAKRMMKKGNGVNAVTILFQDESHITEVTVGEMNSDAHALFGKIASRNIDDLDVEPKDLCKPYPNPETPCWANVIEHDDTQIGVYGVTEIDALRFVERKRLDMAQITELGDLHGQPRNMFFHFTENERWSDTEGFENV